MGDETHGGGAGGDVEVVIEPRGAVMSAVVVRRHGRTTVHVGRTGEMRSLAEKIAGRLGLHPVNGGRWTS